MALLALSFAATSAEAQVRHDLGGAGGAAASLGYTASPGLYDVDTTGSIGRRAMERSGRGGAPEPRRPIPPRGAVTNALAD